MKTLLFVLLISLSVSVQSQMDALRGGAGHFRFGYANHNLSAMNSWLPENYPELRNDFITVGGTGYVIMNRVILGGEGFGSTGTTVSRDTLSASPSIGRGMLNVGYVIYDYKNFLLYPLFGFGGGGTTIRFRENAGFGNLVNRVKETDVSFTNSNLMLSISIGADSYFLSENRKHGFSLGLRAGYIYAMQNTTWRRNHTEIAGPNMNTSGFYLTVGIGGGRLSRK
jgi:hypothetical protein